MKTEDIKTWRDRITTPTTNQKNLFMSMQDEIDDLRAALKERDAEIERLKDGAHVDGLLRVRYGNQFDTQRAVMQQALDALEIVEWNGGTQQWVKKTGSEAIDALKEALK